MKNGEERLAILERSVLDLQNDMEDLFYSLIAVRCRRKTLEEITEYVIRKHFNVGLIDFHDKVFVKPGKPINCPPIDRAIIDGRKWFTAFMRYALRLSSHPLRLNYPFYSTKSEKLFRPVFEGAQDPKTEKDFANRKILLAISDAIKKIAKEEGILDERLAYLPEPDPEIDGV